MNRPCSGLQCNGVQPGLAMIGDCVGIPVPCRGYPIQALLVCPCKILKNVQAYI
jgi:hypothetical protein